MTLYAEHNLSVGKWLKLSITVPPTPENPNCMLNAIVYPQNKDLKSSGLGRIFDQTHDGRHARGSEGQIGNVITLSPLTGLVHDLKWGQPEDSVGKGGNRIIDVKLDKHPYFAIYKDLATIKVRKKQYLSTGTLIGTINPGSSSASGFHLALIKKEFYDHYRKLTPITASNGTTKQIEAAINEILDNIEKWFIDPAGPLSPVNCPGRGRIFRFENKYNKTEYWLDNPMGN